MREDLLAVEHAVTEESNMEEVEKKPKKAAKKVAKVLKVPYTAENKKFVPTYKSKSAAGFDVYANESFWLMPGRWRPVKTGWRFALPEGYAFLSCSRSGNAVKRGLISHIAPGVLDADYRGEWLAFITLDSICDKPITFKRGERALQALIVPFSRVAIELTDTLSETGRGDTGFGGTGK